MVVFRPAVRKKEALPPETVAAADGRFDLLARPLVLFELRPAEGGTRLSVTESPGLLSPETLLQAAR